MFDHYTVIAAEIVKFLVVVFAFVFIAMLQLEQRHAPASRTTHAALCDAIGNHTSYCHGMKDSVTKLFSDNASSSAGIAARS